VQAPERYPSEREFGGGIKHIPGISDVEKANVSS
jgi:hypothetical protein